MYETAFWACLHVADVVRNLVDGLGIATEFGPSIHVNILVLGKRSLR